MRRSYKCWLRPNKRQRQQLEVVLEAHRLLYNQALEERVKAYEEEKKTITGYDQYKLFAGRRDAAVMSAVSMRDTLMRLDLAYKAFFRRVKAGQAKGFPHFRGRDRYNSIPFDNYNSGCALLGPDGKVVASGDSPNCKMEGCYKLRMYKIDGTIRVKMHRPIQGKIKTVVVKLEAGRWFVVFSCDLGDVPAHPVAANRPAVGVDVGLKEFLVTSDGEAVKNPRHLKRNLKQLQAANRELSRRQKGSKRRSASKRKLARLHARIANLRRESHYQAALSLTQRYSVICVEDLDIKGMIEDGRYCRSIADAGWRQFLNILKHKAEERGARVVEVDPRGTTQECSSCGATVAKDLSVRQHDCPQCGLSINRDHNAALNILKRGRALLDGLGEAGELSGQQCPGSKTSCSSRRRPARESLGKATAAKGAKKAGSRRTASKSAA